MNVHHTHIARQAKCAWTGITHIGLLRDNASMAKKRRPTYLREWRNHRHKTLVQAAEYLGMNHGNLSKIERGLIPYNQELLERLSEFYNCEPADLLIRNPTEPTSIWSLWDRAKPGERRQIETVAEALLRTRTGTAG